MGKQTQTIDEAALTWGERRKLRLLRELVGAELGDYAMQEWLKANRPPRPWWAPAKEDAK